MAAAPPAEGLAAAEAAAGNSGASVAQRQALAVVLHLAGMPGQLPGHQGAAHGMAEAAALEGCPAAMGEDRLLRYRAGFRQALHQGQVGPVAFAQVAALFDGEALGHGVAGLFHQQRQWQQVVGHQLQQRRQGVLHQRQACR